MKQIRIGEESGGSSVILCLKTTARISPLVGAGLVSRVGRERFE